MSRLPIRNAVNDWTHVPSSLKYAGDDRAAPLVTIVITTYKRPHFIVEALRSALDQRVTFELEIIVADNDPDAESLLVVQQAFANLGEYNFRYFVHAQNIGMFGNFNRSLELARGEWVTILNDDDLLDPDCIQMLYDETVRHPSTDAIICEKRILDQRVGVADPEVRTSRPAAPKMSTSTFASMIFGASGGWRELSRRLIDRAAFEFKYLGRRSRRIRPRLFFWGSMLGNGAGYVFKRKAALSLGGFYPEDFPGADLYQFARFAGAFHLRQHRSPAATFRLAENESFKLETMLKGMEQALRLQRLMAGDEVPAWWLRLSPLVMAFHLNYNRNFLRAELPQPMVESRLGIAIPDDKPRLLMAIRYLLRGY